jgi:hypothetical protein
LAAVLKNTVVLGMKASAMADLARRTPFSPQPGACLTDVQLTAYLEVSRSVKPAGDEIDAWESGNQPAERLRASALGAHARRIAFGFARTDEPATH